MPDSASGQNRHAAGIRAEAEALGETHEPRIEVRCRANLFDAQTTAQSFRAHKQAIGLWRDEARAHGRLVLDGKAAFVQTTPLVNDLTEKLKRTEQKRLFYGASLVRLIKALLTLGGKGEKEVLLKWSSPLPQDAKGDAETAVTKKSLGVSEDTLLRELGYDPEAEREKVKLNSQTVGQKLLDAFALQIGRYGQQHRSRRVELLP